MTWLLFWYFDFPNVHEIQDIHKTIVGLLEAYIIGHPLMGFMHYVMEKYYPQSVEEKMYSINKMYKLSQISMTQISV